MSELIAKEKTIVVPGEILAKGMDYVPSFGTLRTGEEIRATRVGLVNIDGRAIKLIPLAGKYLPRVDDTIIVKVIDVNMFGWRAETNCAYPAMLGVKDATEEFIPKGADLTRIFDFGDYLVAKVTKVTSQKLIDLEMRGPGLRKLGIGRVFTVNPNKVPRIIGKKGSMVSMIKTATNSKIIVGQNGVIWMSCEDPKKELIAYNTIKKIEEESHISGLTDRIKTYLENATGVKIVESAIQTQGEQNESQ